MLEIKQIPNIIQLEKNGGEALVWPEASSRKMKAQAKMVSVIKKSLKDNTHFKQVMKDAESLQEKKRYYISTMGFSNVNEVRQGKFFELEISETNKERSKTKVEEMCQKLLANLVIEDYKIIENINNS